MTGLVVLANTRILDVRKGILTDTQDIVIERDRIIDINRNATLKNDHRRIDLKGKISLPGLCDAHVHVTAATPNFPELMRWSPYYTAARASEILRNMLMRGFTTVRDAGGAEFGLARAVEEDF